MSKLQIFGMGGAGCTQRILIAAFESNVDFELVTVNLMKGEHKEPAHIARNPFGVIPAAKDGDFTFYESRAITRYVNTIGANKLVPADKHACAMMEQWCSLEQANFYSEIGVIGFNRIYASMMGKPSDEAAVKATADKLVKAFDIMEAHLAKNEYLAGAQFSLADVFLMPSFGVLMQTPEKTLVTERKSIAAWWDRVSARESWTKTMALNEFAPKN